MRKILCALLLVVGFLVPVAVFTISAPPAQAAITCSGDWITRYGNDANFSATAGISGSKGGTHHGEIDFMWCYDNGEKFAKVREYRVKSIQDNNSCNNIGSWEYNPNALNWWNAPANDIDCGAGVDSVSFDPDSTSGTVNVYQNLPLNERCIAAEAKADKFPQTDQNVTDVPTMCFFE